MTTSGANRAALRTWPDLAGRLVQLDGRQAHMLPIRVYFEDTDFSGLVYHASYVRWCERGRSDFLRLLGSEHRALMEGTPVAGGLPEAHAPVAVWATEGATKTPPVAGGQPEVPPKTEPSAFVVRRLNLEYLRPAHIDDVLEVTTRVKELTAATLVLDQRVSRGAEVLCTAEVTVVLVSQSGKVLRLSRALRGALAAGKREV
ncbi:MAG: hotdog domain-containing protein [Hyphomicrobiaceae bacterium]